MKEPSFSVSQAAELARTSVSSVRRWIAEFKEHFSDSAKPEKYGFRYLSQKDLQVLQEIVRLKEENLSTSTINERLNNMVFQSSIVESPAQSQEGQIVKQTTQAVIDLMKEITGPLEARQVAMEDRLEDRLQALEQAQQAIAPAMLGVAEVIERTVSQMRADLMNELRAEMEQQIQPIAAQRLRVDVVWVAVSALIAGLIVGLSVWWFGG